MERYSSKNVFRRRRIVRPVPKSSKPVTVRQVRDILNADVERKNKYVTTFAANATSSGTLSTFSGLTQNNSNSGRVGDSNRYHSLRFYFDCYIQGIGGTNDFTDTVRLTIFKWIPQVTSGAHPVISDIYQDTSVAQSLVTSDFNFDQLSQFKVLFDKVYYLSSSGAALAGTVKTIPLKGTVQWQSSSSSNGTNQIFAIVSSDSLVATHPLYNLTTNIIYSDG